MPQIQKRWLIFIFLCGAASGVSGTVGYYLNMWVRPLVKMIPVGPQVREDTQVLAKVGFESPRDLENWEFRHFTSESRARVQVDESGSYVMDIQSEDASTLFLKEANVAVENQPHLTWEWRIETFPSGKDNEEFASKSNSDFGARVLVVFKGMTKFTSDTIHYVFDDYFPEGTNRAMPYFKHIKMLVVRRAQDYNGEWVRETRDVAADYKMLFGKPAQKPIYAIGVMTDSDNTGTRAQAQYRHISVEVPREVAAEGIMPVKKSRGIVPYVGRLFAVVKNKAEAIL